MKATGRQLRIRELLEGQEFVDLETLCRELHASESSVRRDLTLLEKEGVLKRVYGGATVAPARDPAMDFDWQSTRMAEAKKRIATAAAALIEDDQTVILDGGSTVAAVARALSKRALHVVTNSLAIAELLQDSRRIELTLTGGALHPRVRSMLGPICEQMLASVRADIVVMGIAGITESGFFNSNTMVVGPERQMIEASRRLIVVADHTKFGRGSVIQVAPLDTADVVVSDRGLAPEHVALLRKHDVEVVLA